MPEVEEQARALVRELAGGLKSDAGPVAEALATRIHETTSGLPGDEDTRAATLWAARRHIEQIAEQLGRSGAMDASRMQSASAEYAAELVQRRVENSAVMSLMHAGYAEFASLWAQRIRDTGAPADVGLEALSSSLLDVFSYTDGVSRAIAFAHAEENARRARTIDAMRLDLVRSILDGEAVDLDQAASRLGHDLRGPQVAFVVWSEADEAIGVADALREVAGQIVAHSGASARLVVPLGRLSLAGWIGGVAAGAQPLQRIDAPEALRLRAAFGSPGEGTEGFRDSHRQATLARRVASEAGLPVNGATEYREVALEALAGADPEHARLFVEQELRELGRPDPATRRVAETVAAYLEEGRNRARTSRRLGLHPNTITYRLGKAKQMLGHDLTERGAEVQVALRLLEVRTEPRAPARPPRRRPSSTGAAADPEPTSSSTRASPSARAPAGP